MPAERRMTSLVQNTCKTLPSNTQKTFMLFSLLPQDCRLAPNLDGLPNNHLPLGHDDRQVQKQKGHLAREGPEFSFSCHDAWGSRSPGQKKVTEQGTRQESEADGAGPPPQSRPVGDGRDSPPAGRRSRMRLTRNRTEGYCAEQKIIKKF